MHPTLRTFFFAAAVLPASVAHAATFVVDSLLDDAFSGDSNPGDGICDDSFPTTSECTLRAAIEEANALSGADRIEFSVAGEIAPDSGLLGALPPITDGLLIDASTAPGWAPLEPAVYLNGTAVRADASNFAPGLAAFSGALEIYGLGIVGFPGPLIEFSNGDDGGRVDGCVLGLNADGNRVPHPKSLSSRGIQLNGNNAVIGRTGPPGGVTGLGNVISGNSRSGIQIRGDGNEILGNIIGMTADGLVARGNAVNGGAGILLLETVIQTPENNRIGGGSPGDGSGNHFANNSNTDIEIEGNDNVVDGNTFGFKPGTGVFFANQTSAIVVSGDGHVIGGPVGNRIIDRNSAVDPVILLGRTLPGAEEPATNVLVTGNEIGTATVSLGSRTGVRVAIAGSANNTIENNRINNSEFAIKIDVDGNTVTDNRLGIEPGLGPGNRWGINVNASNTQITFNTIGNSDFDGILLSGDSNTVLGNDIGFATGIGDVGNGGAGMEIRLTTGTLVQGNRILNNGGPGVAIRDGQDVVGVTIFGNSIDRNGGIGIDILEFDGGFTPGPTLNDPGDDDEGGNRRMNFPELSEAVPLPGTDPVETQVTFSVDSDPANQTYPITVDFYRAGSYGGYQGVVFLDSAVFDTFGTEETITLELPAGVGISDHFTALATDADGNTSEFAPARSLGEVIFRDGYED